ncbi:hypothetical protein MP228_004714 [Amoeboaphelidium protococcarum]|nr:hypothetical protein MP228_004714 [Amoeboaphelidium protococcarum]
MGVMSVWRQIVRLKSEHMAMLTSILVLCSILLLVAIFSIDSFGNPSMIHRRLYFRFGKYPTEAVPSNPFATQSKHYDPVQSRNITEVKQQELTRNDIVTWVPLLYTLDQARTKFGLYMIQAWLDVRPQFFHENAELVILGSYSHILAQDISYPWLQPGRLSCAIVDSSDYSQVLIASEARIKFVFERNDYRPAIITCPVSNSQLDMLRAANSKFMITLLPSDIKYSDQVEESWISLNLQSNFGIEKLVDVEQSDTMAICTNAMRGNIYQDTIKTWIEYHKLMGFVNIFMYNYSIPLNSHSFRVAQHYQQRDQSVQIAHWISPPLNASDRLQKQTWLDAVDLVAVLVVAKYEQEQRTISYISNSPSSLVPDSTFALVNIHYYGQSILSQQCLMNAVGKFKYVAFIDLDEYMVAKQESLLSSIKKTEQRHSDSVLYSFGIRNSFSCSNCRLDVNQISADQFGVSGVKQFEISQLRANSQITKCVYGFKSTPGYENTQLLPYVYNSAYREVFVSPPFKRSKLIVRSLLTEHVLVHQPGAPLIKKFNQQTVCQQGPVGLHNLFTSPEQEVQRLVGCGGQSNRVPANHTIAFFSPDDVLLHHIRVPLSKFDMARLPNGRAIQPRSMKCKDACPLPGTYDFSLVQKLRKEVMQRLIENC